MAGVELFDLQKLGGGHGGGDQDLRSGDGVLQTEGIGYDDVEARRMPSTDRRPSSS